VQTPALSARERAITIALLASLVLWNLPAGGVVMYPFKLLATWLHEMSHGLVMLLTGAGFEHLKIFPDTSGIAQATRGVGPFGRAVIASAGYLGTSLLGAAFLLTGQSERASRWLLAAMGVALFVSQIIWVENGFGRGAVLLGASGFLATASLLPDRLCVLAVNLVAAQACVHALLDIRVLFRAQMVIDGRVAHSSDAHNMAAATFGSPWMWAAIWLLLSSAAFFATMLYLRNKSETKEPAALVAG